MRSALMTFAGQSALSLLPLLLLLAACDDGRGGSGSPLSDASPGTPAAGDGSAQFLADGAPATGSTTGSTGDTPSEGFAQDIQWQLTCFDDCGMSFPERAISGRTQGGQEVGCSIDSVVINVALLDPGEASDLGGRLELIEADVTRGLCTVRITDTAAGGERVVYEDTCNQTGKGGSCSLQGTVDDGAGTANLTLFCTGLQPRNAPADAELINLVDRRTDQALGGPMRLNLTECL
jgi:hypothetical protein